MNRRIDDIEVLRSIAVLFVVVQHIDGNLISWSSPAFEYFKIFFGLGTGVDIFFAISGFVIARQLVPMLLAHDNLGRALPSMLSFWVRRAWRLLPSAWLWLCLILIFAVFFNRTGAFGSFHANLEATIAAVLQVANFRFADAFGRYEMGASFVYWSLSLEEQFYLLFPFLILTSRRHLPWLLGLVVFVQMISARSMLGMVLRTDSLALGALIALWQTHATYRAVEPVFLGRGLVRWPLVVFLLIAIGALGSDGMHIVPLRMSLIALLAALLVFFASYDRGYLTPPRPLKDVLLWVGSRSYAIYLIHVPAYFLTREIFSRLLPANDQLGAQYAGPIVLVALALLFVLSELNYRCIEMPCRRYGAGVAERLRTRAQPTLNSI